MLRLRWLDCNLPPVVPQYEVWAGPRGVARLDLGSPDVRYGAEYHGLEVRSSPAQVQHDLEREQDLAESAEWHVDGIFARDVFGHAPTCDVTMRAGVRAARRRLAR